MKNIFNLDTAGKVFILTLFLCMFVAIGLTITSIYAENKSEVTIPLFIYTNTGLAVTYVQPSGKDEVCFQYEGKIKCLSKGEKLNENFFIVDTVEYVETTT